MREMCDAVVVPLRGDGWQSRQQKGQGDRFGRCPLGPCRGQWGVQLDEPADWLRIGDAAIQPWLTTIANLPTMEHAISPRRRRAAAG